MTVTFQPLGDSAIRVGFGDSSNCDDREIEERIQAFHRAVTKRPLPGVVECVPAYTTVAVYYDPLATDYDQLVVQLKVIAKQAPSRTSKAVRRVNIPTIFGGEAGPDLASAAESLGLSAGALVERFTSAIYTVRMIGFLPGFPYLSGLPDELALPRLSTPRVTVPAGSVAIAGRQAGIYPLASPGGWNILGRTSVTLFDPAADTPTLLMPGDRVRFVAVGALRE